MALRKGKFIIHILISLFFITNSCKDEATYTIGIDLTNSYNEENVQVELDGKILTDEPLQTNLSTSLAAAVYVKKTSGRHTLKITIDDTYSKTEVISLKDDLNIDVRYNPSTHEISFNYSDQPTFYD